MREIEVTTACKELTCLVSQNALKGAIKQAFVKRKKAYRKSNESAGESRISKM